MPGKVKIQAEDLYILKSVVDPQVSSNGRDCLFVETTINEEKDAYSSNLYYVDLEQKNEPVQWTFGNDRNVFPRWSPDGQLIAFISNRSGKNQLYVMSKHGGEARQLTFHPNGVSHPFWSPDGTQIAFNIALGKESFLHETEENTKELLPLEVDNMKYKSNAKGFWDGTYTQVAVVHVQTGELNQITSGEHDYELESWSPDGKYIAIAVDLSEDKDFSFLQDIYLYEIDTKELKNVTAGKGAFYQAAWSPDGNNLAIIGHEREYENATLSKIWIYDMETDALTCLTDGWDVNIGDYVVGDFQQGASAPGILWGEDSHSFYFLATDHGNTVVYYGTVEGEIYPALLDQQHVYGLSTGGKLDKAVVAISDPLNPGDLFLLTVGTGELDQLTNVNKEFKENHDWAATEPIQFQSRDGWELYGWIVKPADFQEGGKYPLLLEIHGGPHAMYANTYFHEFQILASNGYVILYINPRGSHGYGQEFVNAVRGDYGGKDYEDLIDAVDYALQEFDYIDPNRLGVTGGSYGGFMTNWIVGHTNRFKAAVTQRSISNWISFYGVSDIGYYFTEWQIKADLKDIDTLWKHSPLAYVDNIQTPLLILHSEKDYRCPIEQAEQLYIALKRQRKTTKFIRFPESNHELSRSGKPSFRIKRLNYITDWFEKYL